MNILAHVEQPPPADPLALRDELRAAIAARDEAQSARDKAQQACCRADEMLGEIKTELSSLDDLDAK
jgi:hypothetical protein